MLFIEKLATEQKLMKMLNSSLAKIINGIL